MLYANYDFMLVTVLVAGVFSAVALIKIRHARKAHGSLPAAFRNLGRAMRSVLRDDGEVRFRTVAEALPQIVWTAIPGSGVDYCNRRWYELTGLTEAQTMGWGWSNALHPDDRPVALENWEKCRLTGESFEMEYRLLNAAGGFCWHLVRATPMHDSDGAIVKWFGACADIDDQIRNQQVLKEQIRQHTTALMEANTLLQSEMRERTLAQPELNLQNERTVRELTKRSNRATNLAKMAELLQSCSEVKDAFSVVAGGWPRKYFLNCVAPCICLTLHAKGSKSPRSGRIALCRTTRLDRKTAGLSARGTCTSSLVETTLPNAYTRFTQITPTFACRCWRTAKRSASCTSRTSRKEKCPSPCC